MTFLNASLIFGLTAIAVPIVLHLIAKREPRRVVFPSVLFLTKRLETNRSKLRVRRWWLLALRITALAALAVALARPMIHRSLSLTWLTIALIMVLGVALLVMATVALYRDLPRLLIHSLAAAAAVALLTALLWGGYAYASGPQPTIDEAAPVAIAIVLDNAPTSAWKTVDDDHLTRMKEIATWMVTRVPPTSRIAIIDRSGTPAAFSLDLASAVSKVDQLRAIEVTSPISAKIDSAIRLVRTSDLESRQVLVISDLARSTWHTDLSDPALVTLLAESPQIQFSVFDLGEFSGTNRTLSLPRLVDATPPRGSPVTVAVTLELLESEENIPLPVTAELGLYEDDPTLPIIRNGVVQRPRLKSVDRTSVQIAPAGSSELKMTIPPLEVGSHHGVVRLIGDDALALDDVRHFTVQVLTPSRVLLVADNADEARSIDLAINAAPFPIDEAAAEYSVERITYADLPVVRLADFDAILLLDPPRDVISDNALQQFAGGGGGILICLGAAAGDEPLASDWLPPLVRRWRSPPPHTFLQPLRLTHPVLAPLTEIPGGVPWNLYRVQQYWQTEVDEPYKMLMRYAGTPHPALLERTISSESVTGHVIITTTPLPDLADPNNDWNDLFGSDAWPAFFLVRNIVERLTKRGAENWMSIVGRPQVVQLPEADSDQDAESRRLQLFPPGDTAPVPINVPQNQSRVVVGDVTRSGTYWLRGAGRNLGFSVNLPPAATSTERIEPTQLSEWFGAGAYNLVTNRDEIELAEIRSANRVSLRSPLMLLVLAVFLLEQILANRFYRSRRISTDQTSIGSAKAA